MNIQAECLKIMHSVDLLKFFLCSTHCDGNSISLKELQRAQDRSLEKMIRPQKKILAYFQQLN